MDYTFTKEDIKFVEKAIELKNKGYYIDGRQLTEVYNRVLHKRANVTNCGSCLRQRITELEAALNRFKHLMEISGFTDTNEYFTALDIENEKLSDLKPSESVSESQPTTTKADENKELTEAEKMKEKMAKVRAARKNKK